MILNTKLSKTLLATLLAVSGFAAQSAENYFCSRSFVDKTMGT